MIMISDAPSFDKEQISMPAVATTRTQAPATPLVGVKASALLAAMLGIFLLYGVGFAYPSVIHNAAHDTRHGIAVPCH